jgi:hypothetical protein
MANTGRPQELRRCAWIRAKCGAKMRGMGEYQKNARKNQIGRAKPSQDKPNQAT